MTEYVEFATHDTSAGTRDKTVIFRAWARKQPVRGEERFERAHLRARQPVLWQVHAKDVEAYPVDNSYSIYDDSGNEYAIIDLPIDTGNRHEEIDILTERVT